MLAQRQRAEHTHDHRAPLRGAPRQVPGRVPVEHPKRKAGKQQAKGSITLHRNAAVQALEDGDIESPAGKSDHSNDHHKDRADSGEVPISPLSYQRAGTDVSRTHSTNRAELRLSS